MFWLAFATGCFVGAAFGVLIMALVVIGKEADKNTPKPCQSCDIFNDPEADTAHCLSCDKVN